MYRSTEVVDGEQRGGRQLVAATTKIRIKEMNEWRCEPGSERVCAESWLKGSQADSPI